MTRIEIVGTGHVGLVHAVAFALAGHEVVAADVDAKIIATLKKGKPTFYEPGLEKALGKALATRRLSFSTDAARGASRAEVVFLSVGTPSRKDGSIDLSPLKKASQAVGRGMRSTEVYQVVAVKSTVIPGTTESVIRPALEKSSGKKAGRDFGLAMNPEFLREGSAVEDAVHPDRIVVGGIDGKSIETLEAVYASFDCPRMRTDLRTAEMVKYATNAFLATKVSFANELANLCDAFGGLNVDKVVEGMGLDPRINPRFLKAGLGFGGSCLPKDVEAILAAGKARGYEPKLLKATLDVNDRQPLRAIALAEKVAGALRGKRIAILGLSFKGGSDDVRESRAISLARALVRKGAKVVGYDPVAGEAFRRAVPTVMIAPDAESALADADVCIVHNDWPQWRHLTTVDFEGMHRKVLIDGRRILNREAVQGIELTVLGG
jgi:UDPglucose 6-dehydrogenase